MKYATLSKSGVAVTAIMLGLVVAACAESADPPAEDSTPTEPAPASTSAKVPAATPTSAPAPEDKKCVASCTTDSECTNSCPALAGGVQCCDLKTNTCWGSKTSACPAPAEASDGGTTPAY